MRYTSIEDLFQAEYEGLVRSLALIEGPEAAADAVQEALIRADKRWAYVSTLQSPRGWIRQVAVRLLLNDRRNRRRRQQILHDNILGRLSTENEQESVLMQCALLSLAQKERVVLALHYLENEPIREIAASLGIPEGTVKSRLHNARRSLRAAIQE